MKGTYSIIINPHGFEPIFIHKLPSLELALLSVARELDKLHRQTRTIKQATIIFWNENGIMEESARIKCQFGDIEEITL